MQQRDGDSTTAPVQLSLTLTPSPMAVVPSFDADEREELIEDLLTSRNNALANAERIAVDHPDHHLIQQTWREIASAMGQQLTKLGYRVIDTAL